MDRTNVKNDETGNDHHLQRVLKRVDGVALASGLIIGSGIFASPGVVLQNVNGATGIALAVWLFAAVIALMSSFVYGELGTMFQSAGGDYDYIKEAFGDALAFAWSFGMFWVIKAGSIAIIAYTFGTYVKRGFLINDSDFEDEFLVNFLAIAAVWIFTVVNCLKVEMASKVMNGFAVLKIILVGMIFLMMIVQLVQNTKIIKENFSHPIKDATFESIGPALVAALWAFDGWNDICFMGEEIRDPKTDMAPIILCSLTVVTLVYFVCNLAYFAILPSKKVETSSVVAVDAATRVWGSWAGILVSLLVASSTIGTLTGSIMTGGRFIYATARDKQFPGFLSILSTRFKTPYFALIVQGIWATVLLAIPGSGLSELLSYFGFASWLFYGLTTAAAVVLRQKRPHIARPFKIPLYPLPPIIVILSSAFMIVDSFWQEPFFSCFACGFVLISFPIHYYFIRNKKGRPQSNNPASTAQDDEIKSLLIK